MARRIDRGKLARSPDHEVVTFWPVVLAALMVLALPLIVVSGLCLGAVVLLALVRLARWLLRPTTT